MKDNLLDCEKKPVGTWKAILISFLIILGIFVFLLLLVYFIPSVSAFDFSIDQQNQVCGLLNFSFVDCYEFWFAVENYESNFTCVNETIYVNQTQNNTIEIEKNCSADLEYRKAEWEHTENMKRLEKNCEECQDCDAFCEPKILAIRDQYSTPVVSSKKDEDTGSDKTFTYVLIAVLVLIVGFIGKKMFSKDSPTPLPAYVEPPPIKSGDNSYEERKDTKMGEFGS